MSAPADMPMTAAATTPDLRTLMSFGSLEWRARAVVEGFRTGLHRSPYHGFSVEFTEYRAYTPGDDLRYLDWRVFARNDRFFIKKYEDETNVRCHFIVDQSRSMDTGTVGWTKARYAATFAATLAYFLHQQNDAAGLLTFDAAVRDWLPARHRPGHLRSLLRALDQPVGGRSTDLDAPLQRVQELVRRRGLLVVVSDFLAPLDTWQRHLTTLAAAGQEIVLFQVLDPAELTLEFPASALFEDAESGRALFINPAVARAEYRQRLAQHQEALAKKAAELGAGFYTLLSDQPLERGLGQFFQERQKRIARQVRR